MKTPVSSHAPDLMRMVSWMRVCCENVLLAIVIATYRVSSTIEGENKTHVRTVLAEERDERTVGTPDDVLDRRGGNLSQRLLLLDVVQNNRGGGAKDEACCSAVEDLVRLDRGLDALDHRV